MKILAIESSACSASVAVVQEDGKILSECYVNTGLTHSQTLMPMVDSAVKNAVLDFDGVDLLAVANGPGSFTGIRIGVAAIKGLASASGKECVGVSTLEAMAYNLIGRDCIAVCCMDARCGQVYTASFKINGETVTRLTEDEAVKTETMAQRLGKYDGDIVFVGDGAHLAYEVLKQSLPGASLAPLSIRYQRASGVALAVLGGNYNKCNGKELLPKYLRLPQAERELKAKREKENEK